MVRWSVVPSEGDGWSVVVTEGDSPPREMRGRFVGLPCIGAQVVAAELQRAYELGRVHAREELAAAAFGDLGDEG